MEGIFTSENLIALVTLTALEIVLGIDNIVFISILVGKLPTEQRDKARKIGLGLAMLTRIGLLLSLSWVMQLKNPLFQPWGHSISGRDLILLIGGLFLLGKATFEIHDKLEGAGAHGGKGAKAASFASILVQIAILDIVFSLDSVITAVGMAQHVGVMIAAVVAAVIVMMVFSGAISGFIDRHPTMKMLALSFLLLIGVMLVAEGWGAHVEKGYIYFAMAFSVFVEFLNLKLRKSVPVDLHQSYVEEPKK
ncbi:MAG: TerC family protein [Planctomycetes bacterium]|nr:TerC family protein [Planctomycetota bacterium]